MSHCKVAIMRETPVSCGGEGKLVAKANSFFAQDACSCCPVLWKEVGMGNRDSNRMPVTSHAHCNK